jgi:hypothetical protein
MVRQLVLAAMVGWCGVASATEDFPLVKGNTQEERLIPAGQQETQASANDALARTAMHQVIDLKLSDTRITDAIDKLRDMTSAQIFVNWKALEAAGVRRDEPLSLRVGNVHASTALDLLLRMASPEGPRLGWMIDNGVVTISTADDLAKNVMIRVYDMRDLLGKNIQGGARAEKVRAIVKLLTDRVDPASWREHGGRLDSPRELEGQLIITQTAENQRAIIDLLQAIRPLIHSVTK